MFLSCEVPVIPYRVGPLSFEHIIVSLVVSLRNLLSPLTLRLVLLLSLGLVESY